ncbi:MAG: hypothetical protein GTO45_24130 [Candidatus Aminicenantes bacterium]|nr:hypothetical protein [Candidatus Aminicenantes bacterium]NIM81841.1 hypothetical protein [Candidatus Aminicenantes bacterium]NIN21214.1 hypothetical protein [Candidatus Aminicenantes bacterium]NIN45038.1 hypothetical protein [Candidatus Aminicenantes bacterium]NIN87856.1 hypothetical protein [Candidatus Aminicenantes bacterium]
MTLLWYRYGYETSKWERKVFWRWINFEDKIGVKIGQLKLDMHNDKKLRGELLVGLKDLGGLKYSEISLMDKKS